MNLAIREPGPADLALWAGLAHRLWPEDPPEAHRAEIAATLGPGRAGRRGFVAEGAAAGFAEFGPRPHANGRAARPVAFLEGAWVAPRARLAHLEALARAEGLNEIGSDALLANRAPRAAHHAWGFEEVERVVRFRKPLRSGSLSTASRRSRGLKSS